MRIDKVERAVRILSADEEILKLIVDDLHQIVHHGKLRKKVKYGGDEVC